MDNRTQGKMPLSETAATNDSMAYCWLILSHSSLVHSSGPIKTRDVKYEQSVAEASVYV